MSREEYVKTLPDETRKQLAELKQHNAEAMKANAVIKMLNADLKTVMADIHDADTARTIAAQQLGASASKTDLTAKESEIRSGKYTDVVTLMTKDTQLRPTESVLFAYLGQGQLGLKKYDDAETAFKKAIELDAASKKPRPEIQGLANSGLGEIYARTNKIDQASAAYDAAVKADPTKAGFYYKNEAVIYSQVGNTDAQAAAADKAIQASPSDPLPYYLKGQSLIAKATVDPKTSRIVLPPGCAEAYQKYLELDPNGPYSADVKGILDSAGQKVSSSFKATKK
jgi:tetratricopeptide (TPR) repeat protein